MQESATTFFTQAPDGKYWEIIHEPVRDGRTSLFVAFPDLLAFDEMLANAVQNYISCFEPARIAAAAALGTSSSTRCTRSFRSETLSSRSTSTTY